MDNHCTKSEGEEFCLANGLLHHECPEKIEEKIEEIPLEDTQCGWGSCRPSWLQRFANIKMYAFILAMAHSFGAVNYSYYSSIITQLEKCFGLTSTMTGFVKNVDNIGHVMVSLVISHYLRYSDKPKVFSVAMAVTSIAIFMFGAPHLIFGYDTPDANVMMGNDTHESNATLGNVEMCDGVNELDESGCSKRNYLRPLNVGALTIFIISELIQGMAQTPKFTLSIIYLDDNAKKKSPLYYGFVTGVRACTPVFGFLLGAWCTSLYVNLSDTDLDPKDPRWVGAWWLGYIICGLCSLVWALPLSLFPPVIPGEQSTGYRRSTERETKETMKDLPKALWRLVTNPVLVCNIFGSCFDIFLMGFVTFFPKYLEMHFGMTAAKASIITGLTSLCSFSLGPIISGILVTKMRMTPTRSMGLNTLLNAVSLVCFVLAMFMGCPQGDWAGTVNTHGVNVSSGCNSNCSCDPFLFAPVCGSDNVNYFSSCYAGCTGLIENATGKDLTGCSCIPDGIAYMGQCDQGCSSTVYPYIALVIIAELTAAMDSVPTMVINTRVVEDRDKALSLALSGVVKMVITFPGPMLYGYIIDQACIVSQTSCTRKGACLLYDSDKFRYMLHGVAVLLQLVSLLVYALGFVLSRKKDKEKARKKIPDGEEHAMIAIETTLPNDIADSSKTTWMK